ncbi:metal ABC transporter substrate-binding protein [Deinococcus arenicola]|uniref:Metal ABC transporter substrate-binding protein n=1 Tax=Deinococcus arenicola TaxID=2994950 RepID=A0ABU4DQ38_9DEIO|nr:metal ABC transporter substrate-binding protein [Deinococcus sp. ZS9-10]MDV6374546.1 metal ABC transporter substrate-binding protein [Deinococcus sp. ZS9-10]
MIKTSQLLILSALLGAGSVAQAAQSNEKKTVLTTFTILADMAKNVAGDRLNVVSITKPGAEIHGYQFTPSDLVNARGADLILNNGLNLELWFEKFTRQLGKIPSVVLTEGITPVNITADAYRGKPNPHAWMSPRNALIYVENIRKAFVKLDPSGEKIFNTNARKYSDQIRAVDANLKKQLATLPKNQRALVTCEGAFSYLTRDYNLAEHYLWPVNAEEGQGTPRQIKGVIDVVRNEKIPAVFCESTVPTRGMEQVAKEAGAKFGGVLYVDSLTEAGGSVPTYLTLLQKDADTILKGLGGR